MIYGVNYQHTSIVLVDRFRLFIRRFEMMSLYHFVEIFLELT